MKPVVLPIGVQITAVLDLLKQIKSTVGSEQWVKTLEVVKQIPDHERPGELYNAVARSFATTTEVVKGAVDPKLRKADFESLVPPSGWLRDYVEWTRNTEPPTVFHFFVGATILGATLKRNVHISHGNMDIYPNLWTILVSPSGTCRKTSCCELGMKLFRHIGGKVLADKLTPESLLMSFENAPEATGLIYAGELKQFLGSQKYMEGMIPLLTRLGDSPDYWSSLTVMRGGAELRNVGLAFLGASTMDWLRMLPSDAFQGGFMSRLVLIVQEKTPRRFPRPPAMPIELKERLIKKLVQLTHLRQRFTFTDAGGKWYDDWYIRQEISAEEKHFAGYSERKPANLQRMAMLLAISEGGGGTTLDTSHLEHASRIMQWVEDWLPAAFEQMGVTGVGEDQMRMLRQLKAAGGKLTNADWMRKNSMKMRSGQFKEAQGMLRESGLVGYDPSSKPSSWYLTPNGWKQA